MTFLELGLHPDLLRAVKALGYSEPTPIQEQAIPLALGGGDLLGSAQTGSGKTAAFALPVMHHLLTHPRPGLRALVIVPTRELAVQVETAFSQLGQFTSFKTAVVIGGVGYHGQRQALATGAQILIATPGRLLDHIQQHSVRLERIDRLVLDEADRMLDMGFLPDIKRILQRLPRERQTMLFSATLAPEVERVAAFAMRDPRRIDISKPSTVAEGISQIVYPLSPGEKTSFLIALLQATEIRSGVIFCRTKHGADRLARDLKARGFSIGVIHSDRSQGQRTEAMDRFREGRTKLLVATDIAARGIDVKEVSHVINFDVPQHPEDYVHRVGRTARAYGVGDAVTLMTPDEQSRLTAIETLVGHVFPRAVLPNFPYRIPPRLQPPRAKTFRDLNWSRFRRRFR